MDMEKSEQVNPELQEQRTDVHYDMGYDTNSMSVPRRNFNKLHNLLKQDSPTKSSISSKKGAKKQQKKADRKGKRRKKHGSPVPEKDSFNKLTKSKHNFLADNTTDAYSSISSTTDHVDIKNYANPPISNQHSNLLSHRHKDNNDVTLSSTNEGGKRKSGRRGKNANEFLASNSYPSSSNRWKEAALMNQNEGEALRRKILAKVEELDPLMCLPKVLCGYSSRRRLKKFAPLKTTTTTTTTSTTHRPILAGGIIDEYLHLLGIIPPLVKSEEEHFKEADKRVKYKKKTQYQKGNTKTRQKYKKKVVKYKNKKRKKSQEEDDYTQQSESGSSSGESDESVHYHPLNRYPMRRRRPQREKFLFNRIRDEDNEENDIDEENEESAEQDDEGDDDLLDDEDVKYLIEKAKMEKLMGASGSHSEENWWDPFDEENIYQKTMSSYYMPPPDPSYDPLASDDILGSYGGEGGGGITGWFSNMFSNIMPSMSWGGGGKKDDDDFKSDPFFTSFDGRSMKNGESRSSTSSNNYYNDFKMPSLSSANYPRNARRGKQIDLEKYFGVLVNSKQLDYGTGNGREDPVAKYRVAVEIGSRATDPTQCDYVYNGCPLAYEEILAIINEPLRQKPSTTTQAPTTTTKNITPPPRQVVVPLHQQEQRFPIRSPQILTLHQQRPHYQNIVYSEQPQRQFYSQDLAHQPQFVLQNHQFHQHPGLYSTSDGILTQVAQPNNRDHKTKIHQALPSGNGEVEINLSYSSEKKAGYPTATGVASNNLYIAPEMNTEETYGGFGYPHYSATSVSSSFEHSQQTDPFSHKVLTYPHYELSNGYKIRRKNQEIDKSVPNEDVKAVSSTVEGASSIFMSESSYENSNNVENIEKNPLQPKKNFKQREQRIPSRVTYNNKGKNKRKHMLKDTYSSSPSSAPLRQSSYRQSIPPQQQESSEEKRKRNGNNKSIMRKKYVKEKQNNKRKKRKKNKGTQNDDNSSSNNSNDGGVSSSNEQLEQYGKRRLVRRKKYPNDDMKRRMKKKRKLHLHKQSSESIEAKKRLKIEAPNAIYPVYGHPFPPPYAGYYHTLHPSTPTSPSFFSYFFGR